MASKAAHGSPVGSGQFRAKGINSSKPEPTTLLVQKKPIFKGMEEVPSTGVTWVAVVRAILSDPKSERKPLSLSFRNLYGRVMRINGFHITHGRFLLLLVTFLHLTGLAQGKPTAQFHRSGFRGEPMSGTAGL